MSLYSIATQYNGPPEAGVAVTAEVKLAAAANWFSAAAASAASAARKPSVATPEGLLILNLNFKPENESKSTFLYKI